MVPPVRDFDSPSIVAVSMCLCSFYDNTVISPLACTGCGVALPQNNNRNE